MKPQANYMPPEQLNQVLEAIPSLHIRKWSNYTVKMLFLICYWCGLRINEALKLKAEDFDLDNHQVFLGKTKTEVMDYAPIPHRFIGELQTFLLTAKGPLFPGLKYGTVIKWICRLGKMLNILAWTIPQSESGEKTKTHIFRKSIGKDYMLGTHDGRKAPLSVVSEKLRHRGKNPLGTTSTYLKVNIETVKEWESQIPEEQKPN
jgi:integrase